jgi:hypothetical protein
MAFLVGALLAAVVGAFATLVGLDRDRAFYPTVAIVVASYYVLFAAMGADGHVLLVELLAALVFVGAALAGFRVSLWFAAAALAGHGLFDLVHGALVVNPGMPRWWPAFCGAYDVVAAVYLAFLIRRRSAGPARPASAG